MQILDAIKIPFYEFQADNELTDKIFNEIKDFKFSPEPNAENGSGYPDYYNKELFEWFNSCIKQVADLYYESTLTFPIVDCWVNKYYAIQKLQKHNHSNAIICGCYYLTSHNSGETIYEFPNPWLQENSQISNISINKTFKPLSAGIKPVKGKLVLFPSTMKHYAHPFKDTKSPKYTIAFNTFPSGVISDWKSKKLEFKTVSVEERNSLEKQK